MSVAGKVIQVAGPAVDVEFPEGQIPVIRTAVRITSEGFNVPEPINIICEVAQHIGESRVRTIALQPTDGLVRGMHVENLSRPVEVPVGRETLGRVLNVIGEPVDNMGPVNTKEHWPIHRPAPKFDEQSTELQNVRRPASRSSICLNRICAGGKKSDCSVVPASARRSSFKN